VSIRKYAALSFLARNFARVDFPEAGSPEKMKRVGFLGVFILVKT
jgi:hypothetical protein